MHLYKNGAKGGTVYVDGSRNAQVLSLTDDSEPIQEQLGLSPLETPIITSPPSNAFPTNQYRGIKQDRTRGTNIGDLCAFCNEGNIVEAGGCNTLRLIAVLNCNVGYNIFKLTKKSKEFNSLLFFNAYNSYSLIRI